MKERKKVAFVSSTYLDLASHRKVVWEVLQSFDVSVRGMEEFGARKEAPLETCLAEVEQCDLYIGIIAFRRGSIEASSGKAFTQVEYERALELNKEILIYLADDREARFRASDFDVELADREKLAAFKRLLRERHTVSTFTEASDLGENLRRDFRRYFIEKPEGKTPVEEEFRAAASAIDRFFLLPAEVSGTDVRLRVQLTGEPFPAARALCKPFYLSYGSAIGLPIKVVAPEKSDASKFRQLFAAGDRAKEALELLSPRSPVDLYATLKFTEQDVNRVEAELIGYRTPPSYVMTTLSTFDGEWIAPEGRAILLFSKSAS